MEPLGALRDKARNTRLLIIALLHERPGTTLSEIANRLQVTVQAVSAHAKTMGQEGLLAAPDGAYRPTPAGLQELHEGVRGLHSAVQGLGSRLQVIHTTSAVAQAAIELGQHVVLSMADGDLAAHPGTDGTSRGRARNAAGPGDEVVVAELEGMVDLRPGRIRVVSLPGPDEGGIRLVEVEALGRMVGAMGGADRIGALGTGASILARRLGPVHLEFAAGQAAFNAAERGLEVLLYASRDRLVHTLQEFEHANGRTLRRIPVEVQEAPLRP